MERLVITGYGVKCPNGYNTSHLKRSLEEGEYRLSYFQSSLGKAIVVGRVPDEELNGFHSSYSRLTKLGLKAAEEALAMAKIPKDGSARVAVIMGSAAGPTEETVRTNASCFNRDFKKYPLLGIGMMSYHSLASAILGEFGLDGKAVTLITGCNASSDALHIAKVLLLSKEADICIVGGSDAPLCEPILYGFAKLHLAEADVSFQEAGIPFSGRDRFVISEGAGVVVLERESVATARKAKWYGELLGVESNNDGLSAYLSDESGAKMKEVVNGALNGLIPTYINSQAMGLNRNDRIEMEVRDRVIGGGVPITSIKGITGHPFGSSGAIQVIVSLLSIEHGFIPKTKCNDFTRTLDIVTETIYTDVRTVCVTTHGFGGNNSCILIGPPTTVPEVAPASPEISRDTRSETLPRC